MKLYVAEPRIYGRRVAVLTAIPGWSFERFLDPRLDLMRHSPDGFSWGYGGSGPSQLALALCADALGDDEQALSVYQDFKWRFIATLAQDEGWTISASAVRAIARPALARAAAAGSAR